MTDIARFLLTKSEAVELAAAFDRDETLTALPVSLGEAEAGLWQVLVYLSGEAEKAEVAALTRVAAAVLGRRARRFSLEALSETDWVAKSLDGLRPVAAGRFLVHGSHDRGGHAPNRIGIEIEAGQAFGTGHHGTTAGCLLAIDRLARGRPVSRALDIGTGSGVLAIAIAKAAKAPVLACDIDPVAVRVARENSRLNGVAGYVRIVASGSLKERVFGERGPFDIVVANILAGPLVALAPQIRRRLAPGGILVLSGLLPGQRARIVAAYRGQGMVLSGSRVLDGWLTLVFMRGGRNRKGRSLSRALGLRP